MSKKTIEQATEEQARYYYSIGSFTDEMGIRCFKSGVNWLSKNLHLLSQSDVAKIPCVAELIETTSKAEKFLDKNIATIMADSRVRELSEDDWSYLMYLRDIMHESLSNFEPKKDEV